MKIEAIVQSKSSRKKTVMRTNPPLTTEVLAAFSRRAKEHNITHHFGEDERHLTANDGVTRDDVKIFESLLTNAEEEVRAKKEAEEKSLKDYFETLSQVSGLKLE